MKQAQHLAFALQSRLRKLPRSAKLRHPSVTDAAISIAIALILCWLYSPFLLRQFNPYDLGLASYGAVRILDGFIPYVEMHIPYGPGQYYIRALLFYLFGTNIKVMLTEWVTVGISVVVVSYWVLRCCTGRVIAVLLSLIIATFAKLVTDSDGVGYLAMLVAVGCMVRYVSRCHARWLVAAGGAIGLVGAIRWDFGAYCGLVFAIALASLPFIQHAVGATEYERLNLRLYARRLIMLLAPAAAVAVPFYAPALLTEPQAILRSVKIAYIVKPYRVLPWPLVPNPLHIVFQDMAFKDYLRDAITAFVSNGFFIIGPANIIAMYVSLRSKFSSKPSAAIVLHTQITTLLAGCLVLYGASRADVRHLLPSSVFVLLSLPLTFWVLAQLHTVRSSWASVLRWGLSIAVFLVIFLLALFGIYHTTVQWAKPLTEPFTAPTLAGVTFADPADAAAPGDLEEVKNYNALVDYIKQHTAADEFIFSGSMGGRHDKVFVDDVIIYFASERHSGIRDYHMDPGSTTRRDIQQQIISDLRRNDVRLIVLGDFDLPEEPNKSRESSGVTDLDDYIHDNYAVREKFGNYLVLTTR